MHEKVAGTRWSIMVGTLVGIITSCALQAASPIDGSSGIRQTAASGSIGESTVPQANGEVSDLAPVLRIDPAFNVSIGGQINALAVAADGKVLAGGVFGTVNGVARFSLVRLNEDGSLDPSFATPLTGEVKSLAVQNDGRIVVAVASTGLLGGAGEETAILRLNTDGTIDSSFDVGATIRDVSVVRADAGGAVLVGGRFGSINGLSRGYIARLQANGAVDPGFVPFSGSTLLSFFLTDVVALPDRRVLYCNDGTLGTNGRQQPVVGRLNPDGTVDPQFFTDSQPPSGSGVYSLMPLPDGKLLVGGSFSSLHGVARNRIARLLADGRVDPSYVPALTSTDPVARLVPTRDNAVYVVRRAFASAGMATAAALSRIDAAGRQDPGFSVGFTHTRVYSPFFGAQPEFTSIAALSDGNLLLAAGSFREGDLVRSGLIRTRLASGLVIIVPPVSVTARAGTNVTLAVYAAGASDLTYQWFKDDVPVAGANRATFAVAGAQAEAAGRYFVRIAAAGKSIDSPSATVTIEESAPQFAGSTPVPVAPGANLLAGTRFALTAPPLSAGSAPLSYQWQKDGQVIAGETRSALFRAAWTGAETGAYRVTVSNDRGAVTSQPLLHSIATNPNWEWARPRPQGNSLSVLQYLNGQFLASGVRGTLLRSTDGREWSTHRIPTSSPIGPIAYGNGTYVALTIFGGVLTSTDGAEWQAQETDLTDGGSLFRIQFGDGRFVAVGGQGLVLHSTDGRTWSRTSLSTTDASAAVAHGGGTWLIVTSRGRVFTSQDGKEWSVGSLLPENIGQAAYGAGLFVATSTESASVFTSPDGVIWTKRPSGASSAAAVLHLDFVEGGFLGALATSTGRYLTSADGLSWREIAPFNTLNSALFYLTRGAGIYVMAAAAPDLLRWSSDGIIWQSISASEGRSFRAVATDGTVAVAVGTSQPPVGRPLSALLNISYDGTNWSERFSSIGGTLNDVAYGAAPARMFVAVGDGSLLITSPDGANWTVRSSGINRILRGVKHLNGRFVAVGDNVMLTSTEGVTWTSVALTGAPSLRQTAYGAGSYVAVGAAGTILRSTDGLAWVSRTSGLTGTLVDVIFAGGQFVAVGSSGEIITSPDGLVWTSRPSTATALASVAFAGGQYFALGTGGGYFVSADAATWTPAQFGTSQNMAKLIEFRRRVVAVGAFGSVLTQTLPAPAGASLPVITEQPAAQNTRTGQRVVFSIGASGSPAPAYQWLKNYAPIPGATTSSFVLAAAQFADAGSYACVVSTPAGAVTSASAELIVSPAAQLANLSIRTSLASAQTLTVGLSVGGNGASRQILVRAAGPALARIGVFDAIADPRIELYRQGTKISENDNWSSTLAPTFAALGAFAFPAGSRDAALLGPGTEGTTLVASGTGPGVILVECYDASLATPSPNRLVNLSARSRVGRGTGAFIAGFHIAGNGALRVLIRGIGPTLERFGVGNALAQARLEVFDSAGAKIAESENWPVTLAPVFVSAGAFALPPGSRDAALTATLDAGRTYTVQVSSPAGLSGEALVEVYELP